MKDPVYMNVFKQACHPNTNTRAFSKKVKQVFKSYSGRNNFRRPQVFNFPIIFHISRKKKESWGDNLD